MASPTKQGVQWLWLVDPELRQLEAYVLSQGLWQLEGTWKQHAQVRAAPFADVALQLDELWVPDVT